MSDLLTLVLGVLTLLGVAVIGFVMWRYRIPPRGLIAMIGALVYLASPVDVLPEVMLGPIGLLDDAGVATAAVVFVYKLVTAGQGATREFGRERPAEARSAGVTAVFLDDRVDDVGDLTVRLGHAYALALGRSIERLWCVPTPLPRRHLSGAAPEYPPGENTSGALPREGYECVQITRS